MTTIEFQYNSDQAIKNAGNLDYNYNMNNTPKIIASNPLFDKKILKSPKCSL